MWISSASPLTHRLLTRQSSSTALFSTLLSAAPSDFPGTFASSSGFFQLPYLSFTFAQFCMLSVARLHHTFPWINTLLLQLFLIILMKTVVDSYTLFRVFSLLGSHLSSLMLQYVRLLECSQLLELCLELHLPPLALLPSYGHSTVPSRSLYSSLPFLMPSKVQLSPVLPFPRLHLTPG